MDGCDSEMALMRTFSNLIDYEWISLWMIERPVQKKFCSLPVGSGLTAQVCIRLSRLLWTFPKYKTAEKFLFFRSLKLHFLFHIFHLSHSILPATHRPRHLHTSALSPEGLFLVDTLFCYFLFTKLHLPGADCPIFTLLSSVDVTINFVFIKPSIKVKT